MALNSPLYYYQVLIDLRDFGSLAITRIIEVRQLAKGKIDAVQKWQNNQHDYHANPENLNQLGIEY